MGKTIKLIEKDYNTSLEVPPNILYHHTNIHKALSILRSGNLIPNPSIKGISTTPRDDLLTGRYNCRLVLDTNKLLNSYNIIQPLSNDTYKAEKEWRIITDNPILIYDYLIRVEFNKEDGVGLIDAIANNTINNINQVLKDKGVIS